MDEVGIDYFKDVSPSNPNPHAPPPITEFSVPSIPDAEYEEIKAELVPIVPNSLRNVDLYSCETRADFMKQLVRNIPTNEYNLPQFIYRADLVTVPTIGEEVNYQEIADMLEAAQVRLTYDQGFPTVANGQPIWAQLEYEERQAFDAFLQYLDQPGARVVTNVNHVAPEVVMNWYVLNFWQVRALAHDMFKIAHHNRLREHRILALNDTHYIESEKAFKLLATALGNKLNDASVIEEMSVPEVVSALEKVVKVQRLAAGLSTTGGKDEPQKKTTSVEVSMREVSEVSTVQRKDDSSADITELLANPDLLAKAQELIIKVSN